MAIIGVLPNNIQNGQAVDATPVMADFNFIVNQVNANGNPIGTLTAPSGTRAVFQQATAPTGWTNDSSSTFLDCAMRFNNDAATGGSVIWSGWNFGGTFSLNTFTLSVAQMPNHTHLDSGHSHGVTDPGHTHTVPISNGSNGSAGSGVPVTSGLTSTSLAGVNISINSSNANITYTGSGAGITPTFTTPQVKYADCIIGIKS